MEAQILALIEEEVKRRVAVRVSNALEVISKLYSIPLARLIKDTAHVDASFCQGVNKSGKRCLKEPRANGFCKFHSSHAPVVKVPAADAPPPVQIEWSKQFENKNHLNM